MHRIIHSFHPSAWTDHKEETLTRKSFSRLLLCRLDAMCACAIKAFTHHSEHGNNRGIGQLTDVKILGLYLLWNRVVNLAARNFSATSIKCHDNRTVLTIDYICEECAFCDNAFPFSGTCATKPDTTLTARLLPLLLLNCFPIHPTPGGSHLTPGAARPLPRYLKLAHCSAQNAGFALVFKIVKMRRPTPQSQPRFFIEPAHTLVGLRWAHSNCQRLLLSWPHVESTER